ncbi:MAG TPA: glycosyltransferase family 4 protein [Candidatus Limnocylindria bacterium]|jgi:phosphatidylinositol alpha-mannosyltransferase|nr:glycosyltransferase family 4 protein [Candidatus Limnocylindria bacterium]
MRIALVSPYDHQTPGGVREHVTNLDRQLRSLGHDTTIVAPAATRPGLADNVECVSERIVALRISGSVARIALEPAIFPRVRRLFATTEFDVVHLHEPLIPAVSLFALMTARSATVGTIHGYRDASALYRFGRPILGRLMRRLDGRTAVSTDALRWASQYFPGDYRIISDGVDVSRFADPGIRPLDELSDGKLNVLFVGRLEPRKGLDYLLSALPAIRARVASVRLVVAGAYSPAERELWEGRARAAGDVVFVGPVSADRLPRVYRSAHVFCAPSTGFEALGIVLLEAMASGVPVVTTDIAGYRTVVTHERDGVVVPPRDAAALARAIAALLADPARGRALADTAASTVRRYDWALLARRYVDLYAESAEHFAARGLSSSVADRRRRRPGDHAST